MARKRDNGEGAIYPVSRWKTRTDGTRYEVKGYRGYVTLGTTTVDGKSKQDRKYVSAKTRTEALRKVRELQNQRDAGTLTLTASPTVREWMTYYLETLAPNKPIKGRKGNRRSTLTTYKSFAKNWIYPHIGAKKLEKLAVEELETLYQAMADAGLSSSAIDQVHAIIRTSLEMAWKRGRMPRNVARLAILPSGQAPKDVREVSLEEVRAVLTAALGRPQPARPVLRTAYAFRTGEVLGLRWPDVDFDKGIIWPRMQIQRDSAEHGCGEPAVQSVVKKARPKHGCGEPAGFEETGWNGRVLSRPRPIWPCGHHQPSKCPKVEAPESRVEAEVYPCGKAQAARCPEGAGGGLVLAELKSKTSEAPLPLVAPVADLLKKRRAEQKRERIQAGDRWTPWLHEGVAANLVFTGPTGRPVDPRQDYDDWIELLKAADVEFVNPHQARHWAAALLVTLGVHPAVAREVLRHADIATTLNIYTKAPSPELRKAFEQMATGLLGEASSG